MNRVALILVIGLTLVGFLLRFIGQPTIPQGFHRDEAGIAYSAYSILQTGRDEWGRFLPLHFKALGDYPPGIYNYLVAVSMLLVGYGELAERLPAILAGTALIPISFILIKQWFKQPAVAIVVAACVAVMPWEIVQSRGGSEATVALMWSFLAFIFWRNWIQTKNWRVGWRWLALASVMVFLALFSYNAAKVAVPLLLTWFTFCWWRQIKQPKIAIVWVLLWWLVGAGSVFGQAGTEMSFQATSVLNQPTENSSLQVGFIREGVADVPVMVSRAIHNRAVLLGRNLVGNYLTYFSPSYLFFEGGLPGRYQVVETGLLFLISLPLLAIGIYRSSTLSKKEKRMLYGWLFLAPLVAALTNTDVPHVKRSLFLFLPLYMLMGLGLSALWQYAHWKVARVGLLAVVLLITGWELVWFGVHYAVHANYQAVHHRSYGWPEVFATTESLASDYDSIYVYEDGDAPYVFYLFYTQYPPKKYQTVAESNPANIFNPNKEVWQLENYTFIPAACPDEIEPGILYVSPAYRCDDAFKGFQSPVEIISIVKAPDTTAKFIIYSQATSEPVRN